MERQPSAGGWPAAWLMTDERMGDALGDAICRAAAAGAGIVVRHHRSTPAERRAIAEQVHASGALLAISRDVELAEELGAALVHDPERPTRLPFSLSVHDGAEALTAMRSDAALVFVSPVFPTNSHPGAPALGEAGALALALMTRKPAIALGGMDAARGERLMKLGWAGWAGVDCWLRT